MSLFTTSRCRCIIIVFPVEVEQMSRLTVRQKTIDRHNREYLNDIDKEKVVLLEFGSKPSVVSPGGGWMKTVRLLITVKFPVMMMVPNRIIGVIRNEVLRTRTTPKVIRPERRMCGLRIGRENRKGNLRF